MNCPICNEEMDIKSYSGEQGIEERYEKCVTGCKIYTSEWAYGSGAEYIGTVILHNHYQDSSETRKENSAIRECICDVYKNKIK